MCYCTVFALFYFEFEGNYRISEYKLPEACIWRDDLSEGFFLRFEFGGANIWRGLSSSEFYRRLCFWGDVNKT